MKDHTEEIDRYLGEEMSPVERHAFEQRLGEDADLAKEFDLQQKIYRTLRDKEAIVFHQKLQTIRNQKETAGNRKLSFIKLKPLLILPALLACGIIIWLLNCPKPPAPTPQTPTDQVAPETPNLKPSGEPQPRQKQAVSPADRTQTAPVPSSKMLALVEKHYQKYLSPGIDTGSYRSGIEMKAGLIGEAFRRKDYSAVLQIAETCPQDDPSYNKVVWAAANAAFLSNDCRLALLYGNKISGLKTSKTKAQEAEMLLLLTCLKCGLTDTSQYKTLLEKCEKDVLHPAHQLTIEIKQL